MVTELQALALSATSPGLLPRHVLPVAWAHFRGAGRENSPSVSTCSGQRGASRRQVAGLRGFTGPSSPFILRLIKSWMAKGAPKPTHSHLNLSAAGHLLGGSSASLGSTSLLKPQMPCRQCASLLPSPLLPKHVGCAHRV